MTTNSRGSHGQPIISNPPTRIPDMTAIASYAALIGNRIVGTASSRGNFSTTYGFDPYPGLEFYETDTLNRYIYIDGLDVGTGWRGIGQQSGLVFFQDTAATGVSGRFAWSQMVTFTPGRFTAPPIVTAGIFTASTQAQQVGVQNVYAGGFTLTYVRDAAVSTTVGWTASPSDS